MWPLRFGYPFALLLVPVVVAACVRWWRRLGGAWTLAAALCLAMAAAGPQWMTERRRVARVYLLDVSGSMFLDLPAALDGVRRSMGEMGPEGRAGLIVFGAAPVVAVPLTEARLLPSRLQPPTETPRADASDLAAAIRLAARQLADRGYDRQVVLLSDGRETTADAAAEAAVAADAGLRIFCVPIGPGDVADARIARLEAPPHVRVGEPYRLVVALATTAPLEVEVTLSRGDTPVARRTVQLDTDAPRRLVATDRVEHPGHYVYTARLAVADRCDANDLARAVVHAEGATRLLYLAAGQPPLAGLLRRIDGLDVTVADPRKARLGREALAPVDCLVLGGVPAANLPRDVQQAIRDWVRDAAGGLITIGGPDSYGPGGYLDTPIEEALPVLCDRPRQLALVVALDKSGSMAERSGGRPKIAFAREAVLGAIGRLRPADRFALLVFDAQPDLRLPLTPRPDPERVRQLLDQVQPHGGTNIQSALERALSALGRPATPPELRHVILLSDGQDRRFDAPLLRRRFADAAVGLSVLMTGTDRVAARRIAALAPDDFHHVGDPAALPAIFKKALLKAMHREQVREGSFKVRATSLEVGRSVPVAGPLRAYIRTIAKPKAQTEWQTEDGDPILARWRYGLGRSVAFASTIGTEWDAKLLEPAAAARLWQQAVRWAARPARTPGFEAEVEQRDDGLIITVRAERDGRFRNGLRLAARVVPPQGDAVQVPLPQVAPGEYRGEAPAPVQGIYAITVTEADAPRLSLGVARNYSREWEAFGVHRPTLDAIVRNGRGRVLPDLAALRPIEPAAAPAYAPLDWACVAAALLLFIAAVARHALTTRRARL